MYAGRAVQSKAAEPGKADGFATIVEPAWEGRLQPCVPLMRRKGTKAPGPTRDHLRVKGPFCGRAELRVLDLS